MITFVPAVSWCWEIITSEQKFDKNITITSFLTDCKSGEAWKYMKRKTQIIYEESNMLNVCVQIIGRAAKKNAMTFLFGRIW